VKLPTVRAAVPVNCEAVIPDRELVGMTQPGAAQPGPLKTTLALPVLKLLPLITNVNACPFTGGFGVVAIELS